MPRVLKTIGQRRHRARKGQVSAIATILGLLLVVTMIANFVLLQLPSEMADVEFQHVVQVQNQLSRFQATILAEAANPGIPFTLSTPVTLGSGSVPPFGPPTTGSISPEGGSIRAGGSFSLSQVVSRPPAWGVGASCANGGGGPPCAGNGNTYFYNYSNVNNTALTIKLAGGGNSLIYNFSGNNDTISITALGNSVHNLIVVINGSDNTVSFTKGGSTISNPVASFVFYGQRDKINLDPSSAVNGNIAINVSFVGSLSQLCPFGNLSSTDKLGSVGTAGGGGLSVNVTWWNANGYVTPRHVVKYPGGVAAQTLSFTNRTGFYQCAFTKAYTTTYTSVYQGGLAVHMFNRYTPVAEVAYDSGAVILSQQGGQAVMISPPPIALASFPSGFVVSLTLVNLVQNLSSASGVATSALSSRVVTVHHLVITAGAGGFFLSSPFFLNITTPYPSAWMNFFSSNPQIFPNGATCVVTSPIFAPSTCLKPPQGTPETISAGIIAQSLQLTDITVAVSIT